jgi:hypothetical protein
MKFAEKFWGWYERNYTLNVGISAFLFLLQIIHLYWLTTDVVFFRIFERSFFNPSAVAELLILLVDYTEIPALITASFVYIHSLRKGFNWKDTAYLIFLNSQWLHIFWISDEFIIDQFTGRSTGTILPLWLAWAAIFIDYLELPVIYDTIKKFILSQKEKTL